MSLVTVLTVINIATRPPAERSRSPPFDFRQGQEIFLLSLFLGPNYPPIQCEQRSVSASVKWQEREADYSPPSTAAVYYE
jgi:hypothetical protein